GRRTPSRDPDRWPPTGSGWVVRRPTWPTGCPRGRVSNEPVTGMPVSLGPSVSPIRGPIREPRDSNTRRRPRLFTGEFPCRRGDGLRLDPRVVRLSLRGGRRGHGPHRKFAQPWWRGAVGDALGDRLAEPALRPVILHRENPPGV